MMLGSGGAEIPCLLDASNMAGDVLDGDGVLDAEAVALALHARLVNEDARIGGEACGAGDCLERSGATANQRMQWRHGRRGERFC